MTLTVDTFFVLAFIIVISFELFATLLFHAYLYIDSSDISSKKIIQPIFAHLHSFYMAKNNVFLIVNICHFHLIRCVVDDICYKFLFIYSASQSVKKIIEINPYMLGTMAGGAADCQYWHRNLGVKVKCFHVLCAFILFLRIQLFQF